MGAVDTPCRESPIKRGPGYGGHRNQQFLHRWVWEQVNGPIPPGFVIRHKCDNRPCFRYDHLELGTVADNARDTVERGQWRNGSSGRECCAHGHPYTPENTYNRTDRPGHRECRTCRREAQERYHRGK